MRFHRRSRCKRVILSDLFVTFILLSDSYGFYFTAKFMAQDPKHGALVTLHPAVQETQVPVGAAGRPPR